MANQLNTCNFTVDGMHCDSCELYVESVLKKQNGVKKASANAKKQQLKVELEDGVDIDELTKTVNEKIASRGYVMNVNGSTVSRMKSITSTRNYIVSFVIAVVLMVTFFFAQRLNVASYFTAETITYPSVFMLGVVASLTSCMAVVGGLVLSLSSTLEKNMQRNGIIGFHVARLLGFLFLGGVIGALGKMVIVNGLVANVLEVLVALVMIVIGLDILGIKLPKIVMPKSIAGALDVFSDKDGVTGAVTLGIATFFLPCAFTQSMQLYALSTGSVIQGALTMFVFALGTLPALALLSFGSVISLERLKSSIFQYIMAFLMIMLAIYNVISVIR